MEHLFSAAGNAALAQVLARRPLLAFDFDGTLAPIVARPDDARVPAALADMLARLTKLGPVAIVTGRRIADVTPRLGFAPTYVVGNHGAEGLPGAPTSAHAPPLAEARERLADHAQALHAAGVMVEDKGASLALHYRLAPDHAQARAAIDAAIDGLGAGVHVFGGKLVVNLVDATAPDKGVAVRRLAEDAGAGAAFFIGDDVNDESVFAIAPESWLTVRIGRDDPSSQARYGLDSHAEVAPLLQRLIAALSPA
jgi:trehalose 6-phosphate phosphatase